MKSFFKFILVTALVLGLLAMTLGALVALNVLGHPDFNISINGAELPLGEVHAAHWVLGTMGLAIAAAVVVVLVPLALLLGLALPALMLGLGLGLVLLAVLGVGALVTSPVVLIVLLLIWLSRRNSRHKP